MSSPIRKKQRTPLTSIADNGQRCPELKSSAQAKGKREPLITSFDSLSHTSKSLTRTEYTTTSQNSLSSSTAQPNYTSRLPFSIRPSPSSKVSSSAFHLRSASSLASDTKLKGADEKLGYHNVNIPGINVDAGVLELNDVEDTLLEIETAQTLTPVITGARTARSIWRAPSIMEGELDTIQPIVRLKDSTSAALDYPNLKESAVISIITAIKQFSEAAWGPTTEYAVIFRDHTIAKIAAYFLQTIPVSTAHILNIFLGNKKLVWSDFNSDEFVCMDKRFNLLACYLHIGRHGDKEPFSRGAYVGSAGSERADTKFGRSGLIGCIRRIIVQHGAPAYRSAEIAKAERRGGVNDHYEMYKPEDEATDHAYVALNLISSEELRDFLGQRGPCVDKQQELARRNVRLGILKVFETTHMFLMGIFRWNCDLLDEVRRMGYEAPKHEIKQRNRSIGLECNESSYEQLVELGRRGGLSAKRTFADRTGVDEKDANLSQYLKLEFGQEQSRQWNRQGGLCVRDDRWMAIVECLLSGGLLKRNLKKENVPRIDICSGEAMVQIQQALGGSFAGNLGCYFTLNIGIPTISVNGHSRLPKDWPRPVDGYLFWRLSVGEVDEEGIPTEKGLALTPCVWQGTGNPPTGNMTSAEYEEIKQDFRALHRDGSYVITLSSIRMAEWDCDDMIRSRAPKRGEFDWTYTKRWQFFVAWLRIGASMLAAEGKLPVKHQSR